MTLSRAEIQKRYRERKKAESGAFLRKDRERKRKTYVRTEELDPVAAKKRRKDTLERVKRYNMKKKLSLTKSNFTETRQSSSNSNSLLVKLNFSKKQRNKKTLKKLQNQLNQAHKRISTLESEKKRFQKRIERARKKISDVSQQNDPIDDQQLTPKRSADREMKKVGLSPKKYMTIRKQLVFSNVLQEEVRKMKASRKISMAIAKKYRMIRAFGKTIGVHRNTLSKNTKIQVICKRLNTVRKKVQDFLEREDNCITLPGKRDNLKHNKHKKQKKILSDYLHNLHSKFCLENPDVKISRSRFSAMRPNYVLLVNFCSRNTCLCSRHQGIALKLKAIQDVAGTKNPDDFIIKNTDDEIREKLKLITKTEVSYTEWKRQNDNGRLRWKQVQTVVPKNKFVDILFRNVKEFREHVGRVKNQYTQMRNLRESLDDGHVMVWMDFAENFTCTALDEVQSAYWTSQQVTLHTTVVYFPKSHCKTHKSIVGISDVNMHNASMVIAMISKLIPIIRTEYSDVTFIHYLTDSPISQYRNKSIFNFLCKHKLLFNVDARWDYLESGHGKGPCDGLGGSVKRSADMAVKQGKAVIQNGSDFFDWAKTAQRESSVSYYFVSKAAYESVFTELKGEANDLIPVSGTFRLHSVVPIDKNRVATRELSCYCIDCRGDVLKSKCNGWSVHTIKNISDSDLVETIESASDIAETHDVNHVDEQEILNVDIGEYCAAVYDGEWYIGIITDISSDKINIKINFMEESGKINNSFKWPNKKDELWVKYDTILTKIPEPYPSGKTKRQFKLSNEIVDLIEMLYEAAVNK